MFLKSKLNWVGIGLFLFLNAAFPLSFILPWSRPIVIVCLFHFIWFGLSSSLYYHRILTHKALKLNIVVEWFFLLGGLISISGDPVKWAIVHRFHHQHSDEETDTHSPIHGIFWAYYGWLMRRDFDKINALKHTAKDLTDKWYLRIWDRIELEGLPPMLYGGAFLYFGGWNWLFLGFVLPIILSYNFHWMLIASLCHLRKFGEERYNVGDNSRNIKWLSLLSFGESMHNNHHRYPRALNFGYGLTAFDFSYFIGKALIVVGLASEPKIVDYQSEKFSSEEKVS